MVKNPVESDAYFGQQYNSTAELPDPVPRIKAIATGVIEVMRGQRPVEQLSGDLTEEAYLKVQRQAARSQEARNRAGEKTKYTTCTFQNLMKSSPRDGVIESVVLMNVAQRLQAVVIRLEGINHRWRATSVRYMARTWRTSCPARPAQAFAELGLQVAA